MRTVREFKNFVLQQAGVPSVGEFGKLSEAHLAFCKKLNEIGWQKKTRKPGECSDIDASAFLSDAEWAELDAEFQTL